MTTDKPKPIIEKITFTEEQQHEINTLLEGKPNKYTKTHTTKSPLYVRHILKHDFYRGVCCICGELPEYRLVYKLEGISRIEYYCQEHFKQYFPNEWLRLP